MKKYEYKVIIMKYNILKSQEYRRKIFEDTLNKFGELGWEFLNSYDTVIIFKREKE